MRRFIQQPPGARYRHVIRRRFVQSITQKTTQAQAVSHPPGDASLARDAFKESDQQQPEIHARCQRWPPQLVVIEPAAAALAQLIEPRFVQDPVQLLVKRMPWSFR